jgi:thiamine kinase-like enzyme
MSNVLVLVDTDDGFEARFRKKLEEEGIDDKYNIKRIVPDTTLEPHELLKKCVHEANELVLTNDVSVFFVDIVIYEKGALDTVGIDIARQLHVTFPGIPVFSITSKLTHEETYDPYYDVFSEATLENFDGVFAKSYLEGKNFSAKRLRRIFEKAQNRRMTRELSKVDKINKEALATKSESVRRAFDADNIDAFTSCLIEELGFGRFWCLIGSLLPGAEGILKTITPGRSGAYVFKATTKFLGDSTSPTRPKSWIIKVCTNKEIVFREAKNHGEIVKTPIRRATIPRLLHPEPKGESGLWGIVYEYEGEADTLLQFASGNLDTATCSTIAKNLIEALSMMYGDPIKHHKNIWKSYFSFTPSAKMNILRFLSEYRQILNAKIACTDRIENFVKTDGEIIHDYDCEADTRHIHGDFNCGNILISSDYNVILIDFASRRQDHVVKDVAKIERDLLFRVADANTPEYYSWDSLDIVDIISSDSEDSFLLTEIKEDEVDQRHASIIRLVNSLRIGINQISPSSQAKEYFCGLLHYCLLGLAHPAISIHRKALSMLYANNIIEGLSK